MAAYCKVVAAHARNATYVPILLIIPAIPKHDVGIIYIEYEYGVCRRKSRGILIKATTVGYNFSKISVHGFSVSGR